MQAKPGLNISRKKRQQHEAQTAGRVARSRKSMHYHLDSG
jgi:hypothetical protein